MIYYKSEEEIELIRESSLLVEKTHAEIAGLIKPGVTTLELDKIAEEFIMDNGAIPAFKGYRGFPNTLCMSPTEQVVHGIPNDVPLNDGDIVSVDCGALKNGFYGDHAYTFILGEVSAEVLQLVRVTKESLYKGIEKAVANNRIGDIAYAIQEHTEKKYGYGVVRELVGHGLGKDLHEDPQVPNHGQAGTGPLLKTGMCIAIEPMFNLGDWRTRILDDNWTVVTADGKISAHFEHSITITESGPEILTQHS